MKYGCPNKECEFYGTKTHVVKNGSHIRKCDHKKIQRFKCKHCGVNFSSATFSKWRGDHLREKNLEILRYCATNTTARRAAYVLGINYKTFLYKVKKYGKLFHDENIKQLKKFYGDEKVEFISFDDMITSIHTKLKPETISMAVDAHTGLYLAAECASIPANGKTSWISRQIYGPRRNKIRDSLRRMFNDVKIFASDNANFKSDKHPVYKNILKEFFNLETCKYTQYKGLPAVSYTYGEKKTQDEHDPLFASNHSAAKARANLCRLQRRTWNTTKKEEMLQNHLYIFMYFENQKRIADLKKKKAREKLRAEHYREILNYLETGTTVVSNLKVPPCLT